MADSTGANTYGTGDYNSIRRNLSFLDGGELDAGEFSYGAGIDVPGFENVPPNKGGRYCGTSPQCERMVGNGRDGP